MAASGTTGSPHNLHYPLTSDSITLAADIQTLATDTHTALTGMLPTSGGTMTGALNVSNVTDSTSSVTGAVKTAGGLGVAKNLYVGANLNVTGIFTLDSKTITLAGNLATSGAYNLTATLTGATNVTFPTTGTLATLAGSETLSNKTLTAPNIGAATGTSVAVTGFISTDDTTNATSTTTGSIQTDGGIGVAKDVYVGGSVISTNTTGRNLLHNGAMQIAQRGTSTATAYPSGYTISGHYTADRWNNVVATIGNWTRTVETDGPTGSGFVKSVKVKCDTADASLDASDRLVFQQLMEGQSLQSIKKGTANAQPLTLSFWVKSNKTGTYIASLIDVTNTRVVSVAYTVDASATWEQKTLTFPADTTGALANDNTGVLSLQFFLAAGTDYTSGALATTWQSYSGGSTMRAVGQTNLAAATNNYWQITGVQLETGSVQTPFEHKDYGQELAECQRYYYRHATGNGYALCTGAAFNTGQVRGSMQFPVTMRSVPTLDAPTGTNYYSAEAAWAVGADYFNSLTIYEAGVNAAIVYNATEIAATAGQACTINTAHASAYVGFSADL